MKEWIALILVAVAGCSGGSSHACNCPANGCDFSCSRGDAVVSVPSGLPPVSSVTANSTCSPTYQAALSRILVSRTNGAGDCDVDVQLADGSNYLAHLHFTTFHADCACFVGSDDGILQPSGMTTP